MNKCIIIGRLTRDPELRNTSNNVAVCTFTVAVDRQYKDASGTRQADFLNCVAWRQQADLISKYFRKGSKIGVVGSVQTRSWDDTEGKKHTATEIIVDEVEFIESKRAEEQPAPFDI